MKVFLLGDSYVNDEIKNLSSAGAKFVNELNNEADLIIDSSNFPVDLKRANLQFIDEHNSFAPVLTSSLCVSVSEQSSYFKRPERLTGIGLYPTFSHSKLLEFTSSKAAEIFNLACTVVPDRPGMVFPRILSMIINEAAQLYYEKIASRDDIDTAMKLGTNYPYGPLEWADRIGIDLIYNILTALQKSSGDDRYAPHPLLKEMMDSGHLGIKTQKGFYDY